MDAVKYLKEKARMCKLNSCSVCSLGNENNGTGFSCEKLEFNNPEKAVAAVEKWSAENPQKTMLQDFLEKHPNAPRLENGDLMACPFDLGYTKDANCYGEDCTACWNRQLEG